MGNKNKNHENNQNRYNGDPAEEKLNKENASVEAETPELEDVVPEDVEVNDEPMVEEESSEAKIGRLEEELQKEKKEYLFLMAEFDNFRKRTLREKSEIIRNGAEGVLKGILPIVDDFERAIKASENTDDVAALKEGMKLIYNKLRKYLELNGVKEIDPEDRDFSTEKHEAISAIPAPDPSLKGKILDTVEKGYMLNDKVLRHAKVVVAQ